MQIKTLIENTASTPELYSEHGLSLYIKTADKQILFDTGASDAFIKNAQKLGIDLSQVDSVVLSHGHYDHGGGLNAFNKINNHAKIYIHPNAFDAHYSQRPNGEQANIGIDSTIATWPNIIKTAPCHKIYPDAWLFSGVPGTPKSLKANKGLYMEQNNQLIVDTFTHEQNLVIQTGNHNTLITGCAHNGIVNIVEHYKTLTGSYPHIVIGGFHLTRRGVAEDSAVVEAIAQALLKTGAVYHTGHCTGDVVFEQMKKVMGERLLRIRAGVGVSVKNHLYINKEKKEKHNPIF